MCDDECVRCIAASPPRHHRAIAASSPRHRCHLSLCLQSGSLPGLMSALRGRIAEELYKAGEGLFGCVEV